MIRSSFTQFEATLHGIFNFPRRAKRSLFRFLTNGLDELLRIVFMTVVLPAAVLLLHRKSAMAIAGWCGSVMLRTPSSGRPILRTMTKAFQMEPIEARRHAREYLAQPFYAFVIANRVLHGRENANNWKVEEDNSKEVIQFRKSGKPFIVATGHFARHIAFALYLSRTLPGPLFVVVGPMPPFSLSLSTLRIRIQYGQYLKVIRKCRNDIQLIFAGTSRSCRDLIAGLKQNGSSVIVHCDAFWNDHGHSMIRSFAGKNSHTFATGAATLGQLGQIPIVPCAPYAKNDGTIVLHWGPVIHPSVLPDRTAVVAATDGIVDFLERAIAERPSQYVLQIGEERRWNRDLQSWEDQAGVLLKTEQLKESAKKLPVRKLAN
jgi:lauroyl/myristoyl acyltransferase